MSEDGRNFGHRLYKLAGWPCLETSPLTSELLVLAINTSLISIRRHHRLNHKGEDGREEAEEQRDRHV